MTLRFLRLAPIAFLALTGPAVAGPATHAEPLAPALPVIKTQVLEATAEWLSESHKACSFRNEDEACEFVNPNDGLTVDGTCLSVILIGKSCLPAEQSQSEFVPEDFAPVIEPF